MMKTNIFLLKAMLLLSITTSFTSCSEQQNILNPANTTVVLPYPPPLIDNIAINNNSIEVKIKSYVNAIDFSNYQIFLTETKNDLVGVINRANLLTLKNITEAPFFWATTSRPKFNSSGTQEITYVYNNPKLTVGVNYHLAAMCFGKQSFNARINDNNGWVLSPLSQVHRFQMRIETNFSLNSFNTNTTTIGQSAFQVMNHNKLVHLNPGANFLHSNNTIGLYVHFFEGSLKALLYAGNGNGVQDLGYRNQFKDTTLLPTQGYIANRGMPLEKGHLYGVQFNGGYLKMRLSTPLSIATNSTDTNVALNLNFNIAIFQGSTLLPF